MKWWTEVAADEWSDAIVAAMKLGGVDYLFFVSGSELNFYQEAIAKADARGGPAPRLVSVTHESVALNAAMGASMVTGAPAATAVHVDAGTFHQGAAVHTAWRGNYPVLMTAGSGPRAFPGAMPGGRDTGVQWLQEPRDQGGIVRQYTKLDHRLEHQDNPGLMVSRALQVAMSAPTGPVYLTIPRETAMLPLPGTARFPTREQLGVARPSWPDPADAQRIAEWLVDADDPVMCTERSGQDLESVGELIRLAELLAIPVYEGVNASRLNFPMTHWAYRTGPPLPEADVVLVMDAVVPFVPGRDAPNPDAKMVWVSPDPVLSRYKTIEYRADLWLPADPAAVTRAIHDAALRLLTPERRRAIAQRKERLRARQSELIRRDDDLVAADIHRGALSGRVVAHELGKLLDPDAVVLNDGLSNGGAVHAYARRCRPGTYFRSGSSAGGWGGGAAFGVKLAVPDRDVVHATGDGYFMFGSPLSALWAAGHHHSPFLTVVFVNGSYSTGTSSLAKTYPDGYAVHAGNYDGGTFEPPPDFAKLAEAAGGYGEQVTALPQLAESLRRALQHTRDGTPALVAVRVPGPL